jgi:peptide/nickel transport system substrate-binding protein
MTHKRPIVSLVLLGLLALAPVFGTGRRDGAATAAASGGSRIATLVIGTTMAIGAANPEDYYYDVLSGTISKMALVSIDDSGNFHPLLADYETADSKTWTFRIREGITWHDGTPVSAGDLQFTLGRGEASLYESLTVRDNRTLDLVLKTPNARYLNSITTNRILPRHIFEGREIAQVPEELATVGNGPFRFVRFDKNAGILEFAAYENYYLGRPKADRVIVRLYGNEDTLTMALKAGEIDMVYFYAAGLGVAYAEDLRNDPGITLQPVKDTSNTCVFVFNNRIPPGNNANVRFAVSKAIDYERFRELFGSPYALASTEGFAPAGSIGYVSMPPMTRDLAAARNYLERAGARDTNGDGIVELGGSPLVIDLHVRNDRAEYQRYGELLKANLAEAGIGLNMILEDVPTFRNITEQQHAHQAMITKFTAYGMSASAGMGALYMDGRNTANAQGQIMDRAYGAIVDRLASAVNMDDYIGAAADCQEYYAATMPAIAIFWDSYTQAYRSGLSGFAVDGTFGILNMDTWFSITRKN